MGLGFPREYWLETKDTARLVRLSSSKHVYRVLEDGYDSTARHHRGQYSDSNLHCYWDRGMCDKEMKDKVTTTSVNTTYTSISGTLMTTNIIMSNWSRMMWQAVVNKAVRMLASGPFASNFFSATATVGGN
ncbi:hypothetical protein KIN20_021469 [Parelaphostrongylus tenuis]|uniref:Uncharacterized protein n=1 Tax=Parelaphostrongylus tenuis TaxID=148309 RepID=A0AAD5N7Y8_PARTN|nr:hypothetical protein KIN20_021469 [Parelaphostrongylus tenuis]